MGLDTVIQVAAGADANPCELLEGLLPSCVANQVTRSIRNREAPLTEPQ
jgi:hypothetical protein